MVVVKRREERWDEAAAVKVSGNWGSGHHVPGMVEFI
jgi:hypothetical protein